MNASRTDVLSSREAGPAALRGSALRAGGYAAGVALSLISAPVLIRHLGVEDFGRYTTVVALVGLVAGLTEAGVNAITIREYASRSGARRDVVMRHLLGIRLTLSAVAILFAFGFALIAGYDHVRVIGTLIAGSALMLASLQSLLSMPLQANLRFGWTTSLELLRQLVTVVLIIALAIAGARLLPFFVVAVVASACTLTMTVLVVRGLMPLRPAFGLGEWKRLLRDTLPWAIATALGSAYFRVAVVVMSLVATAQQTGYYSTSFRVMEVLITIPAVGLGAALPILARAGAEDPERFDGAARRMLELAVIGGTALALLVVLGAPVAIDVLAGSQGAPSIPVLRIHAVAFVPNLVAATAGICLLSIRREWAVVGGNVGGLLAAAGLTLAFVPVLGARGGALATLVAELLTASVIVGALTRVRPATRRFAVTTPPVLACGAAACAVALIPALPAVADVAIGLPLYAGLLRAIGRFPPEVREALESRRKSAQ